MPTTTQFRLIPESHARQAVAFSKTEKDPEKLRQLALLVGDYKEQQARRNQPLYPEYQKARQESEKRLRSKFQDRERHGFTKERFQEFNETFRHNKDSKAMFFNDELLSHHYGIPQSELGGVRDRYREDYSQKTWGEVELSEPEFFSRVQGDYDTEDSVNDYAQDQAFKGIGGMEGLAQMPEEIRESDSFKRRSKDFTGTFERTHKNTAARFAPYRGLVVGVVEQLRAKTGVEGETDDSFADFSQMLIDVPDEDLNFVLAGIIANAGEGEDKSALIRGTIQKLGENFGRGARDLGMDTVNWSERDLLQQIRTEIYNGSGPKKGQTGEEFVADLRGRILESGTPIGWGIGFSPLKKDESYISPEQQIALDDVDKRVKALNIHKRLREIADSEIDPSKGENIVTNGIYQAVHSLPYMGASLAGVPGFLTVASSLAEESYHQLKRESPDMSDEVALAISGPAGIAKYGLERISGKILSGKLPVVERFFNKVVATGAATTARYATRSGTATLMEIAQENTQDVLPFLAQGLLSALREDVPNVEWEKIYGDMAKNQPELLFAILPLTLVGAGVGTVQDVRGAKEMMADYDALRDTGATEAQASKIVGMAQSKDWQGAQDALRDVLKAGKKDTKPIREARAESAARGAVERARRISSFSVAEKFDILPAVRREKDGSGYTLRFNDGSASPVMETKEEAHKTAMSFARQNNISIHAQMRGSMQQAMREMDLGREIKYVFDPTRKQVEEKVEAGEVSEQAAGKRVEQAKQQQEQGAAEASPVETAEAMTEEYKKAVVTASLEAGSQEEVEVVNAILGENENEYQDGIHRTVIRLYKDASPMTVFEEKIEGDADKLIRDGKRDWMLKGLRQWEAVSGDELFTKGTKDEDLTNGELKQAFADLAQSYLIGRAKEGKEIDAKWLTQGFMQTAEKIMNTPLGSTMTGYGEFFRAVWKRAAKLNKMIREGKLDKDLEKELARSVGLTEQNEFDAGVVEEAKELVEDLPFPENEKSTSSEPAPELDPDDNAPFSVVVNPGNEVSNMFAPFMRSPEGRIIVAQEMRRKGVEMGHEWAPAIAAKRTGKDIERERKERYDELVEEKMNAMTPGDKHALEVDPADITPIQDRLKLEGGVKSKTQAEKDGNSTNEYDDMPKLPPSFFGGTLMPDLAAKMFGYEYVNEFWEAVDSERKDKASLIQQKKEAKERVKEIEAEALIESKEWATDAKRLSDKEGSDRKILIGALRTLEAITSALPDKVAVKVGGSVKLATYKSADAMLNEIERRTKAIDRHLEVYLKNEADKLMTALLKKVAKSEDRTPGKVARGKVDPQLVKLFAKLALAKSTKADGGMSSQQGRDEAALLQAQIDRGDIEPEDIPIAQMTVELLPLFAGWHGRNETQTINGVPTEIRVEDGAGSAQRMQAVESATYFWKAGKEKWKEEQAAIRAEYDNWREGGIADIKEFSGTGTRDAAKKKDLSQKSLLRQANYSNMSWDGFLRWFMGDDSALYKMLSDRERVSSNLYTDNVVDLHESVEGLFTRLAGNKFEGKRLQHKMSIPNVEIDATADNLRLDGKPVNEKRTMSQSELITVLLYWRQTDGRRHMEGRKDDEGNVISTWSYDQSFVDEVENKMEPESWEVLQFLTDAYAAEYDRVNKVYRKIFGTNLPKNDFYSPLAVFNEGGSTSPINDDLFMNFIPGSTSSMAGSLRTRGTSTVEPDFRDAVKTYISHAMQMEHFIAYAQYNKDLRAIVNRNDFKDAIYRVGGKEAVSTLTAWVEHIDRGGSMGAMRHEAIGKFLSAFGGRIAQSVLFGKIFTITVNASQLGGAAVNMPADIYARQMSRLSMGKLNWIKALDTPYIRRRIKQMPPIIRQAIESGIGMPSRLQDISQMMGEGISKSDGFFTAATYVMTFDYQMELAAENTNLKGAELEAYARNETERIMDQVAQPVRDGARSRFENEARPETKILWNYASDARKSLDLLVRAIAKGDIQDRVGTGIFVILFNSVFVTLARTAWRDARNTDDDEWNPFKDEDNWTAKGLIIGSLTDPLYGFPVFGQLAQNLILELAGEKTFDGTVLDMLPDAGKAIRRMFTPQDYFLEDDIDLLMGDMQKVFTLGGTVSKDWAALSAIFNVLKEGSQVIKNVVD